MEKGTKKNVIIFLLIFIPGLILDQLTKYIARDSLKSGEKVLIKKVLEFRFLKNTGAVWGSFQGKAIILGLVSVILIAGIAYILLRVPYSKRNMPLVIALSFILCGAVGNLIDRLCFKYVTDFIYFSLINFPIFNVADIYVTCSTILLIILILFVYKDEDFEWLKTKKN